ncbi:cytochrome c [Azorhizobium doebereinerae]|uniref:cytochrome c n=1 Tax=Azorhizobium doebereinerae TaxID=281091 RepID=UPI00041777F9|nr:cytochrome c [Azorhizobium doebereinerae]
MLRKALLALAILIVLVGAGALAVLLGLFERSVVSEAVKTPLSAERIAALAPKGRYLAAAADCVACHTAPGGAPWAGGRAFEMPFGTLYATNISPDPETGIGSWTRADFHRALRDGVGKGGRHLYPAMPYVSYRDLTEEDVDAIYAFMLTRAPMPVPNRADSFPFPYVRQTLTFWNLVNLPHRAEGVDPARSPEWNRGRYLTDALGHCGECHTPRDISMGMIRSRYLKGGPLEGVDAPDISPAALARLGFTPQSLADYFRSGTGPHGVMSFAMSDVFEHSTQHLTPADALAMASYLVGDAKPSPRPLEAAGTADTASASASTGKGGALYVQLCSACHGLEGEGIAQVAPGMAANATLRFPSPLNTLAVVLEGLPGGAFPEGGRMQPMPGFRHLLTDPDIADLVSYMRRRWAGIDAPVPPAAVAAARARLPAQ